MKIYIAAPLFSEADREYNEKVAKILEANGNEVYLPQRNGSINDKSKSADSIAIYEGDTEKLKWCDCLVALLDGPVVDPGVAAEVGWIAGWNEALSEDIVDESNCAYREQLCCDGEEEDVINGEYDLPDKKAILGLYTDSRDFSKTASDAKIQCSKEEIAESQFAYINLYVVGCCKKYGAIIGSIEELKKLK